MKKGISIGNNKFPSFVKAFFDYVTKREFRRIVKHSPKNLLQP